MIRIKQTGSKAHAIAVLRAVTDSRQLLLRAVQAALFAVVLLSVLSAVRNLISGSSIFLKIPIAFMAAGISVWAFILADLIITAVKDIKSLTEFFRRYSRVNTDITFSEDEYTVSFTDINGTKIDGRYEYSAVTRVIYYGELIKIQAPEVNTYFSLSGITEGTPDELKALLSAKLADRIVKR